MQRPNQNDRSLAVTWVMSVLLGSLSLIVFPVGINVAAYVLFSGHPTWGVAQGLGSATFILSILAARLGPLYWVCWGAVATTAKEGAGLGVASLGFLGLIVAVTVAIRLAFG